MAYDTALADRIRSLLAGVPVEEKPMFGGLGFMVAGRLALSASNDGDLLVRCSPDRVAELLDRPGAEIATMGKRTMSTGWIRVLTVGLAADDDLAGWVDEALQHVWGQSPDV